MTQDPITPASGIVPVFPLPDTVFFPGVALPLHVFEPRYREMVRDAMAGEQMLAVTLLRPGYEENYEGSPDFHTVATVGRIERLLPLEKGRCLFDLVGVTRVELTEIPSDKSYRLARVTPRPEPVVDDDEPEIKAMRLELLAAQGCLRQMVSDESADLMSFDEAPFATVVNNVCATLPAEAEARQKLLELDDQLERHRRATATTNRLIDHLAAWSAQPEASN